MVAANIRFFDFTNADVEEHLMYLFDRTHGHVFLATLDRSQVKPKPIDQRFKWPEQRNDIIAWVAEAISKPWTDVFICPYPMQTTRRTAGTSVVRRIIHADVDHPLARDVYRKLRQWGFRIVATGTPGHVQVYGRLSRAVTLAEHRGLAVGLRAFVGGDDKISDNDYCKLPGSWNHKHHTNVPQGKRNDQKYPVRVVHTGRSRVDVDRLATALRAHPIEAETYHPVESPWKRVKVNTARLPDKLYRFLDMEPDHQRRSDQCNAAVLTFAEADYNRDQIHTVLDMFEPGVDKHGARWHNEIDRILGKYRPVAEVGEDFWQRRPVLDHIYRTARANLASPWAVLGVVMLEALQAVPPNVMLPTVAGVRGGGIRSLNYYVLLVGPSSQGKGTATACGRYAIEFGYSTRRVNIGSGEGIARIFKRRSNKGESGEFQWKTHHALLDVPEIGTLNSLMARKENTLTAELCKAWGAESLGFQNADENRTIPLEPDEYRLGALVGAQPGACGPLFSVGATIGLPQRFVYLPTVDPDGITERVEIPDTLELSIPEFSGAQVIGVPDVATTEIWDRRVKANRGELKEHPLDGHALLVRLKTAVALALLDGRRDVSDEDWDLAGMVMAVSARVRSGVLTVLDEADKRSAVARGRSTAVARIAEEDALRQERFDRVSGRVLAVLNREHQKGSEWVGSIASKLPRVPTDELNTVLMKMSGKGTIRSRKRAGGNQYQAISG